MAMACHNCYSCNSHWMSRLGWRMLNTWKEMMAMLHLFRAENAMWFTMIHHDWPIAVGCFWSQGIPSTPGLGHMGPQVLAIHTDFVYVTSKQALRQTEPVLHLNYKLFEYVISPITVYYPPVRSGSSVFIVELMVGNQHIRHLGKWRMLQRKYGNRRRLALKTSGSKLENHHPRAK